ncbi:putative ankyrin repeat-containing domain, PGG domain, ankyrin repeat-containing domain superfamily [Helianthus debilis subsp. tardiflorus]
MATHTTVTVQQPQVSTGNNPCVDLLYGGRRDTIVPLYRASIEGNWEVAKDILQGDGELVKYRITENNETPLHVAAAAGHSTKFVGNLVNMMNDVDDFRLQNRDGNTAFCLAAISGNVSMAKIMIEKKKLELRLICGSDKMKPLYLAAFHGNHDMVNYLYGLFISNRQMGWTNDDMDDVLLKCVQAGIFDVALRILEENGELPQDKHAWNVLQVLARNPAAFHVRSWPIRQITSTLALIGLVTRPSKESKATPLLRLLWGRIMKRRKDVIDEILRGPMVVENNKETYPSQILFIAAEINNTKFLVELIREYHDLIWKRNDDGQTIFHISVSHRHHNIYSLLYEIGSIKDLITPITDHQGNNILHLVGQNPEKNAFEDWVAAPFQIQSEFLWYKSRLGFEPTSLCIHLDTARPEFASEVEEIVPPPCREVRNAEGKTPEELFKESHKDLVIRGMQWINETINQSMVVAALVCTIGFTVVFSIPSGYDQNNGLPILLQDRHFIAFIVMDAISFILSTSSILTFLSIVLSRHQRNTELMLQKWVIGHLALLISILAIVVAFGISFFILYRSAYKSTVPFIVYPSVIILVCLYVPVYFSLYTDAIKAIYSRRYLFRAKHMLYRKI